MSDGKITEATKTKRIQHLESLHRQQSESVATQTGAEEALERELVAKQLNDGMLQAMRQSSMDTLQEVSMSL